MGKESFRFFLKPGVRIEREGERWIFRLGRETVVVKDSGEAGRFWEENRFGRFIGESAELPPFPERDRLLESGC
ncbi:hypothetical protein C8P63_10216 [Melghirimyces profundicolus]|uniref:Uncharacterized protein n=1 Tax=Melghirimyces profundicolus TaxID=1242148 RepID=A0A2T6C891_9BACL|nr:hypothetical protein [Melghirimyces profundicolus]PTX64523.1 hypothetical protein C8P63_10216 [Melghirimyces profundicolus]